MPLSPEDAQRLVERRAGRFNDARLRCAIGYVTPADKLAGRDSAILADRDRKLEAARARGGGMRGKQTDPSSEDGSEIAKLAQVRYDGRWLGGG
jgi:hypothetical protein